MSWAVTRSVVSARRTLPSRTALTCSLSAIARMSCVAPLNANDEVRDATRSERTALNALMISSVIPSLKYSFSGSALMFRNGSTAIEFAAAGGGRTSGRAGDVTVSGPCLASAATKSAAVANRSAGAFASALTTTCSSQSGTVSRTARRRGTGSIACRARIAWADQPVKGGSPASISYSTQARL